jgi:excisionase family DNA binding protein
MTDVGDEALDFLDIPQVAARLRLSAQTVRRLIKAGKLEAVREGRRVLVAPEAVLDYKNRLRAAAQAGRPAA